MPTGTRLLNDDGTASMATLMMLSHHAFLRDLGRFEVALESVARGDASRIEPLRAEWAQYHGALHGHHQMEDGAIFPGIAQQKPALGTVIAELSGQHHAIDPLLERGDRAFAALPHAEDGLAVMRELRALLEKHLGLEEANVIPELRGANAFPPPPDDAAAELYAGGFAWSMHGIAEEVLSEVKKMLPESLTSRLGAAREKFAERCERVWGGTQAGAATTSVPER